jgi:hypothetical protein
MNFTHSKCCQKLSNVLNENLNLDNNFEKHLNNRALKIRNFNLKKMFTGKEN